MTRRETAESAFKEGYNCSQAIIKAYEDIIPEESRDTVLKMATSLGGGMGRLREVCGSVSASFLLIGLKNGYTDPDTSEKKKNLYSIIQAFAKEYEEKNGSIVCRELLGLKEKRDEPIPEKRSAEYYLKRPCMSLIGDSAEILEKYLF